MLICNCGWDLKDIRLKIYSDNGLKGIFFYYKDLFTHKDTNTYINGCCRIGTRFWRWTDRQRNNPQIKIDNAENSLFPKKNEMNNDK